MSFRITYRAAPYGPEVPWVDVAHAETPDEARDELDSWQGPRLNHGDVVRIEDDTRALVSVFDADASKLVAAPVVDALNLGAAADEYTWLAVRGVDAGVARRAGGHGHAAWVDFWEGTSAEPYSMIMAAAGRGVARARVIMLACECAEVILHANFLTLRARRVAQKAIYVARGVALGDRDESDARHAAYEVVDLVHEWGAAWSDAAQAAAHAATCAAYTAYVDEYGATATYTEYAARYGRAALPNVSASGYRGPDELAVSRVARVVRHWVPLSVVLCGRLGLRDPLPLPEVRKPRWTSR